MAQEPFSAQLLVVEFLRCLPGGGDTGEADVDSKSA
jgi:hypothetical protein